MEYILFSSVHGIFSKIDCMIGHKTSLSIKNSEILQSIFFDDNGMMLEIHNRRKTEKFTVEI